MSKQVKRLAGPALAILIAALAGIVTKEVLSPKKAYAFTTRYVATAASGAGDCSTVSDPCLPNTCLAAMAPGDTCTFADGTYTGSAAKMIQPSAAKNWDGTNRFILTATNDGGVIIDGGNTYQPVNLPTGSNGWDIEGFNFRNAPQSPGAATVVVKSSNNIFRRCIASDGSNTYNTHIWSLTGSTAYDTVNGINNLFEDCAGIGQGRKTFENFNNGGHNTLRRYFGQWCESENTGPKSDIELTYYSKGLIIDNAIISEDSCTYPNPYYLQSDGSNMLVTSSKQAGCTGSSSCVGGTALASPDCRCRYPNLAAFNEIDGYVTGEWKANSGTELGNVNGDAQVHGVLWFKDNAVPYDGWNGSNGGLTIAPINSTHRGNMDFKDIVIYFDSAVRDRLSGKLPRGLVLRADANCQSPLCNPAVKASDSTLTNATSIAPANTPSCADQIDTTGSSTSGKYVVTNKLCGTTLANLKDLNGSTQAWSVYTGSEPETLYTGVQGGKLRYRYVDGVLTSAPLWPWPMSARINSELTALSADGHGHHAFSIDAKVQGVFGNFPADQTPTPTTPTPTFTATTTASQTPTPSRTPTLTPTLSGTCSSTHHHYFGAFIGTHTHSGPCTAGKLSQHQHLEPTPNSN